MIGLSSFTRWSTHPSVMFPDTGQNQIGSGTVTLILNWFDELKRLVATDPDWWSIRVCGIPGHDGRYPSIGQRIPGESREAVLEFRWRETSNYGRILLCIEGAVLD